jgi:transcriptional regulator with XRE-family HTH domain
MEVRRSDLASGANQPTMPKHNNLPGSRKRWALNQRELAHLVGVSISMVSRYERGALPPPARSVLALEVVFGRSGRRLFPRVYSEVQDQVMRRAAKLDRLLEGREDAASLRKRQLLQDMAKRGGFATGV